MQIENIAKIVIATDFSSGAENAVQRGADVAANLGVDMELVHVASATGLAAVRKWLLQPTIADQLLVEARTFLEARARQVGASFRLLVGDVVEELQKCSTPGTLVVVGASGADTLDELFFGNTAEKLVRDIAGPVLVVRRKPSGPYRNIALGVDLQAGCARLASEVLKFAPEASITAIHAYQARFDSALQRAGVGSPEIDRHRAEALTAATKEIREISLAASADYFRLHPLVERGNPAHLIVERGRLLGADLLVVARRSRPRLEAFLVGSVAGRVVSTADRDVLVLRGPTPTGA